MALINCKNCGGKLSDRAKKCPHCGAIVAQETSDIVPDKEKDRNDAESFIKNPLVTPSEINHDCAQTQGGNASDRKGHKLRWTLIALTILVVAGAVAVYFGYQHKLHTEMALRLKHEQDSIAEVLREQARIDSLRKDSIVKVERMTRDLTMFELRGPVKSVIGSEDILTAAGMENFVYEFDSAGNWVNKHQFRDEYIEYGTRYGNAIKNDDADVIFDDKGRLTELIWSRYGGGATSTEYKWENDKIGKIIDMECCPGIVKETILTYDVDLPYILKSKNKTYEAQMFMFHDIVTIISTYEKIKFDNYGNWISRTKVVKEITKDMNENTTKTQTFRNQQNRKIEYYPLEEISIK